MSELLELRPIGFVRTGSRFKFDAPSQPNVSAEELNTIVLHSGQNFELALEDLATFDTIWLLWWFHRNQNWRPRVLPPRGPAKRRGVFATRSPHRPNPIGLTSVTLFAVNGLELTVGPLDLVNGTPIFDIKPYLRTVDAHPNANLGWLEEVENIQPSYEVEVSPEAHDQLNWLKANYQVDFTERAFGILQHDPNPHRTRRILQIEPNLYRIACGAWRMYYRIEGQRVVISDIAKGYNDEVLYAPGREKIIDREAQIAFTEWKSNKI